MRFLPNLVALCRHLQPLQSLPLICAAVLWTTLLLSQGHAATAELTTAREVRSLVGDALESKPLVRLRGVVLLRSDTSFMLDDGSDAIYLEMNQAEGQHRKLPADVIAGALVEVEGVAAAGRFAPVVRIPNGENIRVLGTAPLPAPVPLTGEAARSGSLDSHLVVAEGVVRQTRARSNFSGGPALEMDFEGVRLFVSLGRDQPEPASLVDARVRVTGVATGVWSRLGQIKAPALLASEMHPIEVLRPAPANPFNLPKRKVAHLMGFRPADAPGHRICISGVVLHALADGLAFVFDGENVARIECTKAFGLAPGDVVDAAGFPSVRDRSPMLEDAIVKVRGHQAALPSAVPRQAGTLLGHSKDYELVQMDAVLVEKQRTETGIHLLLQSGDHLFKAVFDGPGPVEHLPTLKPGTALSISGLVLFSFLPSADQAYFPNGFSLLVRSPAEVRIVRQPPWWTVERLLRLVGATLALALVFALWNHFLRRRAKVQQEIISAQARREATSDERARLARELHDTLEQEFVGMTRQTEALEHAGTLTPQARGALDLLRQMLQMSRDNARRAVWDLRDPVLLDCGLEAAVRNTVQRIVHDRPVAVNFQAEMKAGAILPPNVQVNVLRLAQEAVANAIKHSDARTIEVSLHHCDGVLALRVTDDGHSGEPHGAAIAATPGHFGLQGMQERCEKLGGRFEFRSRPGGGACVHASIPIPHPS